MQVAALAGQVEQDHRVLAEQLADFGCKRAKALECTAQQQYRRASVVAVAGVGLVVQAQVADMQHLWGFVKLCGAVVGTVMHADPTPAVGRLSCL